MVRIFKRIRKEFLWLYFQLAQIDGKNNGKWGKPNWLGGYVTFSCIFVPAFMGLFWIVDDAVTNMGMYSMVKDIMVISYKSGELSLLFFLFSAVLSFTFGYFFCLYGVDKALLCRMFKPISSAREWMKFIALFATGPVIMMIGITIAT